MPLKETNKEKKKIKMKKNPQRTNLIRSILIVLASTILLAIQPLVSMFGFIMAGFFWAKWYYKIGVKVTIDDKKEVEVTVESKPIITEEGSSRFDEDTQKWLSEQ